MKKNVLITLIIYAALFLLYNCSQSYLSRQDQVQVITDQSELAKIAFGNESIAIREIAIKKMLDEPLLEKLALEDNDGYLRSAAIKRIFDQAILLRVAKNSNDVFNSCEAMGRIRDKKLLGEIVIAKFSKFTDANYNSSDAHRYLSEITDTSVISKIIQAAKPNLRFSLLFNAIPEKDSSARKIFMKKFFRGTALLNAGKDITIQKIDDENRYNLTTPITPGKHKVLVSYSYTKGNINTNTVVTEKSSEPVQMEIEVVAGRFYSIYTVGAINGYWTPYIEEVARLRFE